MVIAINGVTAMFVNAATETMDAVSALYYALPAKYRLHGVYDARLGRIRKANPLEMALQVYKELDHMNWTLAVGNLVQNHVTDQAIGRIGKLTAKANRLNGERGFSGVGGWPLVQLCE